MNNPFSHVNLMSELPDYDTIMKKRPDGSLDYIETLVESKLKIVKLEDRPRMYRETSDKYGIKHQFYDGIDDDNYRLFIYYLTEIGMNIGLGIVSGNWIYYILQRADPRGIIYDEGHNKFVKIVNKFKEERESRIKLEEENKMVQDIIEANNDINRPMIKIKNHNIFYSDKNLNRLYMNDKNYDFKKALRDCFIIINKAEYNEIELLNCLRRAVKYNPCFKNYDIYINDKEEKWNKDQLMIMGSILKNSKIEKCILTDYYFEYITSQSARDFNFMTREDVEKCLENIDHYYMEDKGEDIADKIKKFEYFVDKNYNACKCKTNGNDAVNVAKLFKGLPNSESDQILIKNIFGGIPQPQLNFTIEIKKLLELGSCKYYVPKDEAGNVIRGTNRCPVLFIRK